MKLSPKTGFDIDTLLHVIQGKTQVAISTSFLSDFKFHTRQQAAAKNDSCLHPRKILGPPASGIKAAACQQDLGGAASLIALYPGTASRRGCAVHFAAWYRAPPLSPSSFQGSVTKMRDTCVYTCKRLHILKQHPSFLLRSSCSKDFLPCLRKRTTHNAQGREKQMLVRTHLLGIFCLTCLTLLFRSLVQHWP